jgi:serine/threonine protein kinase
MSELIGKELGLYQILEYISAGGMSTVYKAYHAALDRHVAIKVLPTQTGLEQELRQRFQQEVHLIARLQHAHILPIFDYGQGDGQLYLVMRLIEHGSLADRMRLGLMSLDEISRVIHQVGDALSYAHSQGIVHRDVKPSNVLIDGQGNCYLSDFGLAKTIQASIRFTATGVGLGTPAYMSPEQGKGEVVDARSDIYSLGAMLYEMVTGQVPYQADTPLAVMLKHITAPLPLPSRIRPDIPPALEQVIVLALSKEPDQRFQSVAAMVDAFDGAVLRNSMPIVVPAVPSPAPAQPRPEPSARQNGGQTRLVLPPLVAEQTTGPTDRRLPRSPSWRLIGAALVLLAVVITASVFGVRAWSDQRAGLLATETALSATQVALERNLTVTALALARSTSTSTPTPTRVEPTATQTPPHTPTPVATATAIPVVATAPATSTVTPTATATASPTPTPTATATPTRRPTATPTVRWLPAPVLLAPADGTSFVGWNADVTLRWATVEGLSPGEYYVVRIPYDAVGGVAEFWRQETLLRLPPNFSLPQVGFADRHYDWTVQVMLCLENCYKVWDDQVAKKGEPVGDKSGPGQFYWQSDISGAPPTDAPPTPTRNVPGG